MTADRLELLALPGIPMVQPGDDLAALILAAADRAGLAFADGDVLVVAQKVFSKSEGRYRELSSVVPGVQADEIAKAAEKDPRLVELILGESRRVLRHRPGLVIVEHKLGFVMANAGIDHSNVPESEDDERVLLLPEDPDGSCARLRTDIAALTGRTVAVVMNDSVGRAWRNGTVGTALGAAGLQSLLDLRGKTDLYGRPLLVTQVGIADELSSAASLIQGEADEGRPAVLIRGFAGAGDGGAASLIRAEEHDLFR